MTFKETGSGGGGPNWVETYIEAHVGIASTYLGVPKSMTAFLSGEMKDTVELVSPQRIILASLASPNLAHSNST